MLARPILEREIWGVFCELKQLIMGPKCLLFFDWLFFLQFFPPCATSFLCRRDFAQGARRRSFGAWSQWKHRSGLVLFSAQKRKLWSGHGIDHWEVLGAASGLGQECLWLRPPGLHPGIHRDHNAYVCERRKIARRVFDSEIGVFINFFDVAEDK